MTDNKIKILLIARWPVGGIRTYFRYVYNNFDPQQYSFTLIAPNLEETPLLLNELSHHNIKYVALDDNPSNLQIVKLILTTLKKGKHDIIHSHGLTAGICTILPSILFATPHLLTIHDLYLDNQFKGATGLLKKMFFTSLFLLIDRIHTVSNDSTNYLIKKFPIFRFIKNKIHTIPNGIECERFICPEVRDLHKEVKLGKDTFLIGFLGRFMSPKGFIYLVDALKILYDEYHLPKSPIVMTFGEGAFIREEKINVKNKGIEDKIIFMPFTADVASTLKGLDVVVMPSLWEACPLLPMEAMVAGVPVIGTDCTGLREVLKDTPCKVVPSKNSAALAEAIAQEINSPSKHIAESFSGSAAQRFDVKLHSRKLEILINQLLKRNA
jgi:glycosyltransferase involved in cell wall biosynthesis